MRIDLDGARLVAISALPIPRPVALLRVPPQPAPLEQVLAALAALTLPDTLAPETRPYLQVRVQATAFDPTLRARIEATLEHKPVRLVQIERSGTTPAENAGAAFQSLDQVTRLQPDHIFRELCRQELQEEPSPALLAAFTELLLADEGTAAP